MSGGGKRIRPVLTMISCGAAGGVPEDALKAAVALEFLHNFTLVHDDIMDKSPMRRNRPTIHTNFSRHRTRRTRPTQKRSESRQLGTPKHRQKKPKPEPTGNNLSQGNPRNPHKTSKMGFVRLNPRTHQRSRAKETEKTPKENLNSKHVFYSFQS